MIGHLDKLPYAIAKGFLDQTEDAQALPFLLEIEPFMEEQAWLALLNSTWPRIKNADDYRDALLQTPYGQYVDEKPRRKK
ncbi:MAG: hypothetical protein Q8R61_07700 [Thiobacillus sp.]|uniref:hypothetical protein n=1 Tax=Thiobacillus sp. TaxID=924 RepID=UPI00273323F2|nr:hypothetical protein [Thiobacillus sp.]MDP3584993.1 hypothetical protein [Thiobacillus sp.]